MTIAAACMGFAAGLSESGQARAEPPAVDEICRVLAQVAADNDLPEEFFTRLIWQESRFDSKAVSPKGAQGIAQFTPQTAAMRGLANAFEPLEALRESAAYLRELRTTFSGNLGLAAAAYNAGPGAVEAWFAGRGMLPFETQAYVRIVTGYAADAWTAKPTPTFESSTVPTGERCAEIAKAMMESVRRRLPLSSSPAWGPWGVQLVGNWSEGGVLAAYERLRRRYASVLGDRLPLVMYARRGAGATFVVRVSEKSRAEADALCGKLRAAGGACIVLRNPRD
ncbi:MAG: lytic transglycosylase domain-containing protein [Reyranella sp.]|uniref:lytic transglycosylase domain-containing protein n=1 Tax=Reyranella sp. TaxID=1929291 RepID=UPI001ACBF82B|nr:lytic transglycosylase domain-containing protein [Reyranella sp.]MBN9091083.1 lytic transglycosylase domain-containing protein [Reyranella sp.]